MATWYMINTVVVVLASGGTQKLVAGELFNDAIVPTANVKSAGGEYWTSADPTVAASAAIANTARSAKGASEAFCESVMRAGASMALHNGTSKTLINFPGAVLPAKGVSVHTQIAAGAPVNATSGFTIPLPRRALEVVLGTTVVTSVTFTVKGTAVDGSALTASVHMTAAGTAEIGGGADVFETITSFTSDVDPGGTIDLKTADGFGVGLPFTGTPDVAVDGVVDGSVAATNGAAGGVKSGTNPNGTHTYTVRAQRY